MKCNSSQNYDTSEFPSLEVYSDTFENVSWWNVILLIILVVDHISSDKYFVHSMLHLLQHFLPSAKPCLLEGKLENSCCFWILYGFSHKPSFTIQLRDLSEISSSFVIFLMLLHGFLFTIFLTTSVTLGTNSMLSIWNWIGEVVCSSWNFFCKHSTVLSPHNSPQPFSVQ